MRDIAREMEAIYRRVLVPVNGTAGDRRVLEILGSVVQKQPVGITLIYVVEVPQSMPLDAELPDEIEKGEAVLAEAEAFARQRLAAKGDLLMTELLQARSAGAAIVDEAIERNANAIVMAATNRLKYGKITMGETVVYVLRNAPCEVVVVRQALD